jgi:NADP-dependent 3-hydroxy acid dehydrogenase YdfG
VLVTGATSGFGEVVARRLALRGERVIAVGRRAERLATLAHATGARALPLDVTDRAAVDAALAALEGPWAEIDVLVNSAGLALGLAKGFEAAWDDWERMIATNCTALAYVTRQVLPGMVARGRGHVVNLGSVAAHVPYVGGNVYGATKAFVAQLSANLRAELVGTGVRLTLVEIGAAETEFSLVRFGGDEARAKAVYQGFRPLTADDVGDAIVWACDQPAHVDVSRIELYPTAQAAGGMLYHRG